MQQGVTLTVGGKSPSPNPFTITSNVYASPGYGLLSNGVFDTAYPHSPPYTIPPWTVFNLATVRAPGANGIYLLNGGTVINSLHAAIYGASGISIATYATAGSAGSVTNSGIVIGAQGAGVALAVGAVDNALGGLIGGNAAGVSISSDGVVTNSGTILGTVSGVALHGGGSVANFGTIMATATSGSAGVSLTNGGRVSNMQVSLAPSPLIEGYNAIKGTQGVKYIAIYNSGTLVGTPGDAIALSTGGSVTNASGGTIVGGSLRAAVYAAGYSGVQNEGVMRGFDGVNLSGGYVDNLGTGYIAGGVIISGGAGAVLNQGGSGTMATIAANPAVPAAVAVQLYGVVKNGGYLQGGVIDQWGVFGTDTVVPTVANEGLISGTYDAVIMRAPSATPGASGVFSNTQTAAGSGTIGGANGVVLSYLTATVTNLGNILSIGTNSSYGYGLQLRHSGGTIDNGASTAATGYIYGSRTAVSIYYGSATTTNFGTIQGGVGFASVGGTYSNTLVNFGTIIGSGGHAVEFGDGNNLLIDQPGAVFSGDVVALLGSSNTLELASGASSGTLHGLGSAYADFASVTIDAGADWYIDGTNLNGLTFKPSSVTNQGIFNVTPGKQFNVRGSIDSSITVQAGSTLSVVFGATLAAPGTEIAAVIAGNNGHVVNFGSIGQPGVGVTLQAAGTVVNGSRFSAAASIDGYNAAVDLGTAGGSLSNYGTLRARGSLGGVGVIMNASETLTNGVSGSGTALITGIVGVYDTGGTIVNGRDGYTSGTIYGSAYAVRMKDAGALLTNFAHLLASTGVYATGGTISNDGSIVGGGTAGLGVDFVGSGTIVNGATGGGSASISGAEHGIGITNGGTAGIFDAVTVQNDGVVNGVAGNGIDINDAFATVDNRYQIEGKTHGIFARQGSLPTGVLAALTVTNTANGVIQGAVGIQADSRVNLFNAGTIIGTGGTAVALGASNDSVTLMPGASLVGTIDAGGGNNLLELAGPLTGTIQGFGSSIVNFATLMTDANATWDFAGSTVIGAGVSVINQGAIQASMGDDLTILAGLTPQAGSPSVVQVFAGGTIGVFGGVAPGQTLSFASSSGGEFQIGNPGAFAGTIAGFVVGGPTIDLPGVTATGAGIVGNVLEVRAGGGYAAYLPLTGSFTNTRVLFGSDGAGGTAITLANALACFAEGTRLLTARGYVPIETLRKGEPVWAALQRRFMPLTWIGRRHIECHGHARPTLIWPVLVAADAFGVGRPACDILLSPDHAVFVDDVLIPIRLLINGSTIVQVPITAVTYYHVELPRHDIVLADGLPAESYLDAAGKGAFENSDGPTVVHADFVVQRWEAAGCAPLIVTGPQLGAARQRVNAIAAGRGARARKSAA